MTKRNYVRAFAVFGMLFASATLFAGGGADKGKEPAKKTLTYALDQEPSGLNPILIPDQVAITVCNSLFDTLVTFSETISVPEPNLAERWDISKDGLVYTFFLRKGVKFHNGAELKAADVKFTMETILDKKTASPQNAFISMVTKVEAVDDYTVRFTLDAPYGAFLLNLGTEGNMGILPAAYAKEVGLEAFSRKPIGTGPFKFVSWASDDRIVLARNDDYWRVKPKLDQVVFRFIPKAETVAAELQAGGVDIATNLSPQDVERLGGKGDAAVMNSKLAMTFRYVGFSEKRAPYNDVRFRKAIYQALDVDKMVKVIYGDTGFRSYSWIPVGVFGDDVEYMKSKALQPDQAAATAAFAQLKAEGVIPADFEMSVSTNQDPFRVKVATAMVAELQKYGIKAKVESLEWGTLLQQLTSEKGVDCYVMSWSSVADPDRWVYKPLHSGESMNFSKIASKDYDALIEKARSIVDIKERTALYNKLLRDLVGERYTHIPLVWLTNRYVYNTRLTDLSPNYPWLFVSSKRNVDIVK